MTNEIGNTVQITEKIKEFGSVVETIEQLEEIEKKQEILMKGVDDAMRVFLNNLSEIINGRL